MYSPRLLCPMAPILAGWNLSVQLPSWTNSQYTTDFLSSLGVDCTENTESHVVSVLFPSNGRFFWLHKQICHIAPSLRLLIPSSCIAISSFLGAVLWHPWPPWLNVALAPCCCWKFLFWFRWHPQPFFLMGPFGHRAATWPHKATATHHCRPS
jgi:hypothetical protein